MEQKLFPGRFEQRMFSHFYQCSIFTGTSKNDFHVFRLWLTFKFIFLEPVLFLAICTVYIIHYCCDKKELR